MAFVAASSTNSVFKSHNIRHHLEHPWLWQCQISPLMLTQHVSDIPTRKRVSSQHPLLRSLHHHLRLSPISNSSRFLLPCPPLPLLYRFCSPPFSSPMFSLSSTNDSDAALDSKTVRAVIKGRVQGVFYRDWTVENAKELGLKGWVRNRRDGTVEALFSGSPEKVHKMEQRCRHGPPAAIVTGFDVFPCNDDPGTGFERRQTA